MGHISSLMSILKPLQKMQKIAVIILRPIEHVNFKLQVFREVDAILHKKSI
jgi:hypothetical protein